MREHKYKLVGHEVVACDDLMEWAQWYETAERRVMQTVLIDGSRISTVFLGIDHSWSDQGAPILFETALFSGEKHYCEFLHRELRECEIVARYATWGEAENGHMEWIEKCVPPEMIAATVKETSDE